MVTIHDLAKTAPRMSKAGFGWVLREAKSPFAAKADTYYDLIVSNEHDPGFWLGICLKEHSYGTNPNSVLARNDTKSWTNARTVRHPEVKKRATIIRDSERKSDYVKYASVEDSLLDGMYRLDDPTFVYQQKKAYSIKDVVALWAPSSDDNDPAGYAQTIAAKITEWEKRFPPKDSDPMSDGIPGVPFVAADSRHYTKGRSVQWPDLLIQHHTDGYDSLNWLTISPSSNVSSTYLLHNNGLVRAQLVKHSDTPHTTGTMNARSISCEWERKWPNQQNVPYAAIGRFWAQVVMAERKRGNPHFAGTPRRDQLRDHNDFYSTSCPGNIDMDRLYKEMVSALNGELPQQPPASKPNDPNRKQFDETGHEIINNNYDGVQVDMLNFYEKVGGILLIGLPLTGMWQDDKGTYRQICENAVLEFWPNGFGGHTQPLYRFGRYLDHVDEIEKRGKK